MDDSRNPRKEKEKKPTMRAVHPILLGEDFQQLMEDSVGCVSPQRQAVPLDEDGAAAVMSYCCLLCFFVCVYVCLCVLLIVSYRMFVAVTVIVRCFPA